MIEFFVLSVAILILGILSYPVATMVVYLIFFVWALSTVGLDGLRSAIVSCKSIPSDYQTYRPLLKNKVFKS